MTEEKQVTLKEALGGLAESFGKKLKKALIFALCLLPWYCTYTPENEDQGLADYVVPDTISVKKADYYKLSGGHFVASAELKEINGQDSLVLVKVPLAEVDFAKDFLFEKERYTIVKEEDWWISRVIGHVAAIPIRIIFWDWDMSWGPDAKKSKAMLSILENNKSIKGLTVRVGYNAVWKDVGRLFKDEKVKERNHFLARVSVGLIGTLAGELFSELRRGDYYNPMTQTVVMYSNVIAVGAHEIGHHQDFQRFPSDWEYSMSNIIPTMLVYKEWRATDNAHGMLTERGGWEFYRYLLPALLTYLMAMWFVAKYTLRNRHATEIMKKRHITGDEEYMNKRKTAIMKLLKVTAPIKNMQRIRLVLTWILMAWAGMYAYNYVVYESQMILDIENTYRISVLISVLILPMIWIYNKAMEVKQKSFFGYCIVSGIVGIIVYRASLSSADAMQIIGFPVFLIVAYSVKHVANILLRPLAMYHHEYPIEAN